MSQQAGSDRRSEKSMVVSRAKGVEDGLCGNTCCWEIEYSGQRPVSREPEGAALEGRFVEFQSWLLGLLSALGVAAAIAWRTKLQADFPRSTASGASDASGVP
ncbi:hypothetical protein M8818_004243 [Zalaria obscura]|uniref:Uncharacterized protein n=1 Tax=Zalaria obscura TaxID=2024903 RepID=A0ACC3SCT7_9PEZI